MASDVTTYSHYFSAMDRRLVKEVPESVSWDKNYEYNSELMDLLGVKPILITDLDRFLKKQWTWIKPCLRASNGKMFQSPVILLMAYYLHLYDRMLCKNWPIDNESLQNLYRGLGYSYGNY